MDHLKRHVITAVKTVGRTPAEAQSVWNLHRGGANAREAFIQGCGLDGLAAAATAAEAAAAQAMTAEKVADKADKPACAAAAVTAKATAQTARKAADDAQQEAARFLAALAAAEAADAPADPMVAINAAKGKADQDLQAIEEIAKKIHDDVVTYKAAVITATGADPVDNPDVLATAIHGALTSAQTAHANVVNAAGAGDPTVVGTAATQVAAARTAAETARDDLAARVAALKRKETIDNAKAGASKEAKSKRAKKKAKKAKAKEESFVNRHIKPQGWAIAAIGIALLALLFATANGLPWKWPAIGLVAIIVVAAIAALMPPETGRRAAVGMMVVMLVVAGVVYIFYGGSGSDGNSANSGNTTINTHTVDLSQYEDVVLGNETAEPMWWLIIAIAVIVAAATGAWLYRRRSSS